MILFLTVIAVSIDALIASFGYTVKNRMTAAETVYCAAFTFLLCVVTLTVGSTLVKYGQWFKIAGGVLFLCLGIKSFTERDERKIILQKRNDADLAALGIGIASDAALACLTIAASGWQIPLYAFYMFAAHLFFILLGAIAAGGIPVRRLRVLSGVMLVALGIYKLCA